MNDYRQLKIIHNLLDDPMIQTNIIYCGDCLYKLKELPDECIDLIYIDPPFNSNRNYEIFWGDRQEKRSFEDRFGSAEAYVKYMRPRMVQLYRVLKTTGSFYYHCDWHASHYVKVWILDQIFGFNNFQNEIIWYYRGAGISKKRYARRHDSIFFYTKSKKWNFNPDKIRIPYAETTKERFSHYIGNIRKGKDFGEQALNPLGKHPDDVITNIQPIAPSAKARLGYPTQKPVDLLDRIIRASSEPDDIILDSFCGCGTTLVSAHNLKRKWLGIDISPTACKVMSERLKRECGLIEGDDFCISDLPKTVEELRKLPPFEFQNWAAIAIGAIPNHRKSRDLGIDGWYYPLEFEQDNPLKEVNKKLGQNDFYQSQGIPIQVKQRDKVGRNEIDNFETVIKRDGKDRGIFIAFDYTDGALRECIRAKQEEGLLIFPIRVSEILDEKHIFKLEHYNLL